MKSSIRTLFAVGLLGTLLAAAPAFAKCTVTLKLKNGNDKKITVLTGGRVLTEGSPAEIAANQQVRELYLGDAHV